ncbi:MAG TPA: bi-domain-containing oxidoreductase [Vicinamibacterales bacterium]|nr:bi-domain-containing oxidoreductase [Vicinamibacterales bacterium]
MKQVVLEGGRVAVVDVPAPLCPPGHVLVRTSHSLISTGTELATTGGGQGVLRQAIANPDLIRKVREKVSTVGLRRTVDLVRARRQSAMALGYSASGKVMAVGDGVTGVAVGARVACAGAGHANHAEVNAVPGNLVAVMPDGLDFESAACATVGAIALQGVRRAAPTLGEQIVVIGLGLIGQMTAQLLRAHGARVLGVDVRPARVALARTLGMEAGAIASDVDLAALVRDWTGGTGADAAVVCASGGDSALLNAALDVCRRKGRLVLVGDVPIRIHRERIYKKEIDFLISTSYGPGRYDPAYEQKGLDYPIGYVRWTEGRNLAEVLRLMSTGALQVRPLIAQSWPADQAQGAYDSLRSGDAIGALIDFDLPSEPVVRPPAVAPAGREPRAGRVRLAVIGTGAFFKGVHHPMLTRHGGFSIDMMIGRSGLALADYARRHGVPAVDTSPDAALRNPDIDAVLIATRHDLHASLVLAALQAGKHVFVEKPLALTVDDCSAIVEAAAASGRVVMVGFNRRFAPASLRLREAFRPVLEPKTVLYRVNAGLLPAEHWLRDPAEGGGRLVGEGVHFLDWARWFVDADPVSVHAAAIRRDGLVDADNVSIVVQFAGGSLATIHYCSQGASAVGKERIEVFGGGRAAMLDDFAAVEIAGTPHAGRTRRGTVEKGHFEIVQNFHDAIVKGAAPGVTAVDGWWATWCARAAEESLRTGKPVTRG